MYMSLWFGMGLAGFGLHKEKRGEQEKERIKGQKGIRERRERREGWLTTLTMFSDQIGLRDQIGQFWNVLDLVGISSNLRIGYLP